MKSFYITDAGKVRSHNEDSVTIVKNESGEHLMIVADGMGGHRAGEVATFYRGNFFCGQEYESIINTITHRTFKNVKICEYPCESCNDCNVLTKFGKIYYSFINH